jgi:hypothetical protein
MNPRINDTESLNNHYNLNGWTPSLSKARGAEAIESWDIPKLCWGIYIILRRDDLKAGKWTRVGDSWVSDGCLVDSDDDPPPIEAHINKKWWFQHRSVINNLSLWIMFSFKIVEPGFIQCTRHCLWFSSQVYINEKHYYIFLQYDVFL